MTPGQKRDACRFPTCAPLACVIPLHSPSRDLPYSFFFFFSSFSPVISSPIRSAHSPADARDYSWPLPLTPCPCPPWRSTSRRMTCASRDVTSMCHENPRDVGRTRGHEVISLFSFFVALFILVSSPPKVLYDPWGSWDRKICRCNVGQMQKQSTCDTRIPSKETCGYRNI